MRRLITEIATTEKVIPMANTDAWLVPGRSSLARKDTAAPSASMAVECYRIVKCALTWEMRRYPIFADYFRARYMYDPHVVSSNSKAGGD